MTGRLAVTLLGVGSSGGVPRVGGDWGACDPSDPRNRRRRCGALLEYRQAGALEPTIVLIDTSPDLRAQLLDAGVTRADAVVYTHDHADQTHGIDDVRPLVMMSGRRMPVFMDSHTRQSLQGRFPYIFGGASGYPALMEVQPDFVANQAFEIEGPGGRLRLLPLAQDHGAVVSYGFRIGPFAYSNDVVGFPPESFEALRDLDLWIVDALRYTPHPTHAHLARTLEWIGALKPQRAVLTNLHIDLDFARLATELPDGVEPAYDGWRTEMDIPDA